MNGSDIALLLTANAVGSAIGCWLGLKIGFWWLDRNKP